MKKKYVIMIVFILCLAVLLIPNKTFAANKVINANEISEFKKTKSEIQAKWNKSKLNLEEGYSIYQKEPSYEAPYSGGVVKQEYLDNVLANLNYYRYLIGSPQITTKMKNREDLQAGTVLQYLSLKSGNQLSHWLYNIYTKPDDMTQEFYDLGAYADHNIISSYSYGAPVFPFFNESYFEYTSGHRTSLLSPFINSVEFGLGYTTYGHTKSVSFDYSTMPNAIAAYPSPGYFPKQDFISGSDWDIYLNMNKFSSLTNDEIQNVEVKIKCVNTNKTYKYKVSDKNLYIGTSIIHIQKPDKETSYYEGDYEVTVSNLKDSEGNFVDLKYTVKFFDKFEGIKSNVNTVRYGNIESYIRIDGDYDEQVIRSILPKTATVILESSSNTVLDIKSYKITKGQDYWGTTYKCIPTFKSIPSWVLDKNNVLKEGITVHTAYSPNYDLSKTTYKAKSSSNISITATFTGIYKEYSNYTWIKKKGDSVSKLKNSNKYKINVDDNKITLKINSITPDDEAEYYLINTAKVPYLASGNPVYISPKIKVKMTDNVSKVNDTKVINQSKTSIKLQWKEQKNATGYKVYKFNSSKNKYEYLAKVKNKNYYNIENLTAGTTYKFKIRAFKTINGVQYLGEKSDPIKATTCPKNTQIKSIAVGKNKATLNWKKVNGVTGYIIYMSTEKNSGYKKIATVKGDKTLSYTKNKLKKGKKYYFKIRTYRTEKNNKAYGKYSNILKTSKVK